MWPQMDRNWVRYAWFSSWGKVHCQLTAWIDWIDCNSLFGNMHGFPCSWEWTTQVSQGLSPSEKLGEWQRAQVGPVITQFSEPSFHPHLFCFTTHHLFILLHSGIMSMTSRLAMTNYDYSRHLMTLYNLYPFIVIFYLFFFHFHFTQGKRQLIGYCLGYWLLTNTLMMMVT